jgi:hypothetical protein
MWAMIRPELYMDLLLMRILWGAEPVDVLLTPMRTEPEEVENKPAD